MKRICLLIILLASTSQALAVPNYYESLKQCRKDRNAFSDSRNECVKESQRYGQQVTQCVNTIKDYQHILGRALLVMEHLQAKIKRVRRKLKKAKK